MKTQNKNGAAAQRQDLILRLKRFALVLCGEERLAAWLTEQVMAGDPGRNLAATPAATQFMKFRQLHDLWKGQAGGHSQKPTLFAPGNENAAIQSGLDPAIAGIFGRMSSRHRALLLLVYGENYSYAATGQLLDLATEELMAALTEARRALLAEGEAAGMVQNVAHNGRAA